MCWFIMLCRVIKIMFKLKCLILRGWRICRIIRSIVSRILLSGNKIWVVYC